MMKIRKSPLPVPGIPSPGLVVSGRFSRSKARAFKIVSILLALTFFSGTGVVYSAPIIVGAGADTGSTIGFPSMQGYDFVPTTNLTLTALGFWGFDINIWPTHNGVPREFQVGLWDTATNLRLADATISIASTLDSTNPVAGGRWRYEQVTPVNLSASTSYTLAFHVIGAQLLGFDTLLISEDLVTNSLTDVVPGSTRFLLSSVFTFPTLTGSSGGLRGNVNAQVSAVPIPAAAWLFASALGLLGWMRRKGK